MELKGFDEPVVAKVNITHGRLGVRNLTLHEASILAYLQGRAGAPRLIACDPKAGVILMEYLGPFTLFSLINSNCIRNDEEWRKIML